MMDRRWWEWARKKEVRGLWLRGTWLGCMEGRRERGDDLVEWKSRDVEEIFLGVGGERSVEKRTQSSHRLRGGSRWRLLALLMLGIYEMV